MLPWLFLNFLLMASAAVVALVLIILYPGGLAVICVALIALNGEVFEWLWVVDVDFVFSAGLILYFFQVAYSLYLEIEYEERLKNMNKVKMKE